MLRLAALMHDVGKPKTRRFEPGGGVSFHHHEVVGAKLTRKRLQALRFPKDVVDDVSRLVELHLRFHGYGSGAWTDSAVRRYVADAGPLLDRLHKLTRSDCTTRNRRKAEALRRTYDDLEERIARLREQEELDAIRPDLDGNEIMAILGVPPGPVVGKAWAHLKELRLDRGPMSPRRGRGRAARLVGRPAGLTLCVPFVDACAPDTPCGRCVGVHRGGQGGGDRCGRGRRGGGSRGRTSPRSPRSRPR